MSASPILDPTIEPSEPAAQAGPWLTRQHVLALVLIVVTLAAFALCSLILFPFLTPLAWALALAVVAHPLHAWIERHVKHRAIAAGLGVALVSLIIIVPAGFVVQRLVYEASNNIDVVDDPDVPQKWRAKLGESSFGEAILWIDARVDFAEYFRRFVDGLANRAAGIVSGSIWTVVYILITLFTLFFLFRDRHEFIGAIRSLVPLSRGEADEVFRRVHDTISATVYGSLAMALLQGTLGGIMFWLLGLPSPVLWGLVMAIMATIPNLGAFVIWLPAATILAIQGEWGKATILAVWGATAISLIDNLLYPIVVGSRLRMHPLLVFFAILGGLLLFGPAGLILGPAVFAVTEALLEVWRRRTLSGRAAENGVSPLVVDSEQIAQQSPPPTRVEDANKILQEAGH